MTALSSTSSAREDFMKVAKPFASERQALGLYLAQGYGAAVLSVLIILGNFCSAQQSDFGGPGGEVLTRGPVHEAFAEVVAYDPEPGVIVTKAPPDPIEEIPPEERPEGYNVTWIPGYWSWD